MKILAPLSALLVVLAGVSASAQTDAAICGGVGEPADALVVAKVAAREGGRAIFLRNGDASAPACPADTAACRQKAYVVDGDLLIVGKSLRDFVCATYISGKGFGHSGWLPKNAVATIAPQHSIAREKWIGRWRAPEQTITVRPGPTTDTLAISGEATYGARDPDRVKRGAVNIGEFEVTAHIPGDAFAFTPSDGKAVRYDPKSDDCGMRLRLQGEYLIAMDNQKCGGLNVTFSGVYRRDAKPRP
jgi:hypothetical protein